MHFVNRENSHQLMSVKTYYPGHNQAYQSKFRAGQDGWDEPAVYDAFAERTNQLLDAANVKLSGHVLDLGCGAGNMSEWLISAGAEHLTGVDISETAIERARARLPHATCLLSDFTQAPTNFADETFNAIFDSHFLHCIIGEDRQTVLTEIHRLLKPDGLFFGESMCTPVTDTVAEMIGFDPKTGLCITETGLATRYIGTRDALIEELEQAGFAVVHFLEPEPEDGVGNLLFACKQR
jgi:ubiquinone/menaquinone biosynthesis C-methylase UbiE